MPTTREGSRAECRPRSLRWLVCALWVFGLACGGADEAADYAAPAAAGADGATVEEVLPGTPPGGLADWVADIERGLEGLPGGFGSASGTEEGWGRRVVDLYITRQEFIERYYGSGGLLGAGEALGDEVTEAESRFHALLTLTGGAEATDSSTLAAAVSALLEQLAVVVEDAESAGLPLDPRAAEVRPQSGGARGTRGPDSGVSPVASGDAAEVSRAGAQIRELLGELEAAEAAYAAGAVEDARAGLLRAYLDHLELVEPLLAPSQAARAERLIHLELRPAMAQGEPAAAVSADMEKLYALLREAEVTIGGGTPFWLGAFNGFVIILREGLEAVLLIGAILAYLSRVSKTAPGATMPAGDRGQGAPPRGAAPKADPYRSRVYWGIGLGLAASLVTWVLAQTLIPIDAGNRELIEGLTALLAVGVLLYVSNWLFQKTYVQDWKEYLQERVGRAVTTGSALAMAGLAFAAVYREGFETVLFAQALMFDAGPAALLTGVIPGFVVVIGIAVAIIRLGLRLPLRQLFTWTNVALLYLAWLFLGSGLYNLYEAGLFTATPLAWAPDHPVLRGLLGFYPLMEIVAAQLGLLTFVVATYGWYRFRVVPRAVVTR